VTVANRGSLNSDGDINIQAETFAQNTGNV